MALTSRWICKSTANFDFDELEKRFESNIFSTYTNSAKTELKYLVKTYPTATSKSASKYLCATLYFEYEEKIQREDYDYWEREFLDHANAVSARDIKENQDDYIFRCDFFELKELIDVKPEAGSCYIRSVCEPFDIEMELDLKKAENWLTHFGLYPYTQIHASGHLNYDDIKDVIETVQPKVLIPVHTQHPEVFQNLHDNVAVPEKGKELPI